MAKKALLNAEEQKRIAAAVSRAEEGTGGEIVTAIISESDDYAFKELLFAVIAGLLSFVVLALFIDKLSGLLDRLFWRDSPSILPLSMALISLIAGALAYFLSQIPAIDRLVVGRRKMADAVRKRALRHFVESAAYDTVDRTGILLFISVLERRVELIADRGINEKVAPDTWDRVVSALTRGIREGRSAQAIETAVRDCGIILAEHVPPRTDDTNELNNNTAELEKGS